MSASRRGREVRFDSAGHSLAGTLVESADARAAAVVLTGSGPLDRNANMKRRRLEVSRQLAEHLGGAGITTLRFDKRGVGESEGEYYSAGFYDNVADAAAAIAALRSEVDPLPTFVVGHSEGALIATRLAATGVAIDGAVLLAGPARSGKDILLFQAALIEQVVPGWLRRVLRVLRVDVTKSQARRIARLESSTGDTTRIQLVKLNARWFREFMAYDPTSDLRSIELPLLAITGAKDIQVPPDDLDAIARRAGGPVETHLIPDLTHILRRDPDPPSLRAYKSLMRQPTDTEVMELVSEWILRIGASRSCGGSARRG